MMEEALRQLIDEAYGVLGWLQGIVQFSDRARAYKIKKLQEAICAAEAYLESDEAITLPIIGCPGVIPVGKVKHE